MKQIFRARDILEDEMSVKKYLNWLKNPITISLLNEVDIYNQMCKAKNLESEIHFGFVQPGETWISYDQIWSPVVNMAVYGPDDVETMYYPF
jgi:hypothetical protein